MTADIIPMREPRHIRLRRALDEWQQAGDQWIEKTIALALELAAARQDCGDNDIAFNIWLAEHCCDDLGKTERAAFINLGRHIEITREKLQITTRRSIELIWTKEVKPSVDQIDVSEHSETSPPPTSPVETPQIAPSEPEKPETPVSENEETPPEVSTPPRKSFNKAGRVSPIAKLPDADLVHAHVLGPNTRTSLAKLYKSRKTKWIWSALVTAIKTGIFGNPTSHDIRTSSIRLLLPWAPSTGMSQYNLDRPHMEQVWRDIITPLLRDQPELKRQPGRLEKAIDQRRRDHDEQQHQQAKLVHHKEKIAALPANEQAIIAFGEPLWPSPHADPDISLGYDYRELLHATYYARYFLETARKDWRPVEKAMTARHLTKYIEPLQPGFVTAVRYIFNAYEKNPNGTCEWPRIPVNFGYN
jgi:hypothetical protein